MMKTWKKVGLGMAGVLAALVAWGLVEPYILDVETETATIPNLPEAWEGQTVAQISDFQTGMWMDNGATVRRSVQKLIELNPAAVMISGDFIYHALPNPDQEIQRVVMMLEPLTQADIPTYAVLGNHDYGHKPPNAELASQVSDALEAIGIVVLENEAIELAPPSGFASSPLYLVGVGALIANNDRVERALAAVPQESPRIVMMHNPESFQKLPADAAPLAVAGHTHGGQVRMPMLPNFSWLALTQKHEVHGDGWISDYGNDGNQLYVNRGIGFSDVPLRINCRPEVTLFTLQAP